MYRWPTFEFDDLQGQHVAAVTQGRTNPEIQALRRLSSCGTGNRQTGIEYS